MNNGVNMDLAPKDFPKVAYFALTGRCNLRCEHCFAVRESEENLDMSDQVYDRFCEEVLPSLDEVILGGNNFGEQLLSRRLEDFVGRVAKSGVRLNLVTNGVVLKGQMAEMVVETMSTVQVSAEGVRENYERVRHVPYERFRANLNELVEAKRRAQSSVDIFIKFSACKTNLEDAFELLETGVDGIRIHYIQPKNPDWEKVCFTAGEAEALESSFYPRLEEAAAAVGARIEHRRVSADARPGQGPKGGVNGICSYPWVQVSVRETGDVLPCHMSGDGLIMGSLHTKPFQEIWTGKKYQRFRNRLLSGRPIDTCKFCSGIFRANETDFAFRCRYWVKTTLMALELPGAIGMLKRIRRRLKRW